MMREVKIPILFPLFLMFQIVDDRFIFTLPILLVITNLFMFFFVNMPSEFRCPLCHSADIIDYEKIIECPHCGRRWHKEFISGNIDEEDILSDEELEGILHTFGDELKDPEKKRRFLDSLKEDLH
jgi:hypothetical protein